MVKAKDLKQSKRTVKLQDKEYRIVFDLNALDHLEQYYGSIDDAFARVLDGSLGGVRALLWAGINSGLDDDEYLSVKQVGALIELDKLDELIEFLVKVFEISMPEEVTKKKTPSK